MTGDHAGISRTTKGIRTCCSDVDDLIGVACNIEVGGPCEAFLHDVFRADAEFKSFVANNTNVGEYRTITRGGSCSHTKEQITRVVSVVCDLTGDAVIEKTVLKS